MSKVRYQSLIKRLFTLAAVIFLVVQSNGPQLADAIAEPEPPADLPNVLIIGDSISKGYTKHVQTTLQGKAHVTPNEGNAKHTGVGLKMLDRWLGDTRWDVIHFNWGLWDLCYRHPDSKVQGKRDKVNGTLTTPLDQYKKNLDELVVRLKETDAELIWASTTVVPKGEAGRKLGDDTRYNQAAREVMQKHGIETNDLHALTNEFEADLFVRPGDVHYTDAGYRQIGKQVSEAIVAALAKEDAPEERRRAARTDKPNFIVIFTDDQGYNDLSCFGGKHISTPRIDRMAAEGAKLTSFYVAAPVCTPSRAALMTGCYPRRIDMATGSNFGVLLAGDAKGLHPDEVTIAEVLKSAGYTTGMFGKWHLGDQPEFLPTRQGFDAFFGLPYSHDIHPYHTNQRKHKFPPLPLLVGETVVELDPDADFLTRRITERAVTFITEHQDKPFFLYVPHPIPHRPLHASPTFMHDVAPAIMDKLANEGGGIDYKTRDKLYKQAIAEIDWSVGQILDALDEHGIDENTFVIFTSDNGPRIGSARPLKGGKGSTFEGGMRMPAVVRWPGKIKAGQDNAELMTAMDLLPTFAQIAGAQVPDDRVIDGKDIWPVLSESAESPHEAYFYHKGNALEAVRSGPWKLRVNKGKPTALFNLEADIGETKNILHANPEIANDLLNHIKNFETDLKQTSRPAAFVDDPKPLTMTPDDGTDD